MLAWTVPRSYVKYHGAGAGVQAEAPWVHYAFDVELIFGHCIEKLINFIFLL